MSGTIAKPVSSQELRSILTALVGGLPEPRVTMANTALLVIDMQYMDAHPDYGLGARAKGLGFSEFMDYYWRRVSELVVPNIQRLLGAARKAGLEVVHTRVAAQCRDGRDSSRRQKAFGLTTPRDTIDAEFLPEVAPEGDELVVDKSTSSIFNSTNIDRLLRNMGIENLIITGVSTNGCVESSTRSAAEHDYGTIIVEDATATYAPELQEYSIISMSYKDAVIKSTEEVVRLISSLAPRR